MFQDDFKQRYTTIPFAIYRAYRERGEKEVLSHQHKEVELISVTEGCADFYIDSQHYRAQPGDVLVISPYAIHRAQTSQNAFTSYFCICFDLELLCDRVLKKQLEDRTLSGTCLISADQPYASSLAACIKTAYFACMGNAAGWELEAVGQMSLLFGLLKKQGCLKKALRDDHRRNFGKEAMAFLAANFAEPISSHSAADALYLNHSYFCRLFKKTFDCCFADYVCAYRLEKAKHYLTQTTDSISQIAFCTGFNSCSYFGKIFKQRFGVTPREYRLEHKKQEA